MPGASSPNMPAVSVPSAVVESAIPSAGIAQPRRMATAAPTRATAAAAMNAAARKAELEELGTTPKAAGMIRIGVIAPAGLPADVLEKLNTAVNDALKDPDYRQIVESQGAEVVGGTPEEFTAFVKEETKRWTALIKAQNISIQ